MPFLMLSFDLGAHSADTAEAACFAAGAMSVTLSDAHDDAVLEPAPGEVRLWPATRVQALFAGEIDAAALIAALTASLGITAIESRILEDRPWEREWLKDYHAVRCGRRLWVSPRHERIEDPDAVIVRLDPGLAFGTGTHPTTALCLSWLDAQLAADMRVIDYGCGSGILGIAAARLGAAQVWCYDIDPQALIAARENALANEVATRVTVCASATDLPAAADVLLANILAGPLCELASRFAGLVRAGGRIVLAGLLEPQALEVTAAYDTWFDMSRFASREEWVVLEGSRRHDGASLMRAVS
jgi:ribosomal protein L11 methyltransferase